MIFDKTLAIAILARDCEKSLKNNISKIECLRKHFRDSIVIVIENDSIDQTKNILTEWERNSNNIVVISEDYHTKTIPDKTKECPLPGASIYRNDKMSFYRNKYMEYLKSTNIEYDYLMIIDIDVDGFDEQGIVSTISNAPSDWTALFANGVRYLNFLKRIKIGYYDGYPLILFDEKKDKIVIEKRFKELEYNICKIVKIRKKEKYIKCISAFGGIGIYKYQYIKDARYYAIPNNRSKIMESLAEHISLNYELYKKSVGANYIATEMVVYYEQIRSIKFFIWNILPFKVKIFLYELFKRKNFPD